VARGAALPLLLLLGYGVAFASAALGGSLLVFDDHPGQLYRLWHVVTRGPAPWAWEPGWWTGYPELQFYPPGFAYAGALLHWISLGRLPITAVYQALLWITYLAPGMTTFVLLARMTGGGWAALPAAFVALTFAGGTPGIASGVEGGVHTGMVGARLAWALLPLLLLVLHRSIEEGGRPPALAAPLVAAIVLTHPAELPAAVAIVLLAAHGAEPRGGRLRGGLGVLVLAAALTSFWTVPLLARLAHTRALAWGELTLGTLVDAFARQPLLPVLVAAALLAVLARRERSAPGAAGETVVARLLVTLVLATLLDRVALEPLGARWLPADRIVDGAWLALILAAGLGWARLARRFARPTLAAAGAVALCALFSLPGRTLVLWPRAAEWPTLEATVRGLRLEELWSALRRAPEGRVLFVRSAVPLVHGTAWWRPHTHLLALTPMLASREIVNGTFTHPSPLAALVYRGDAGRGPVTALVETLDGVSLFGQPLAALDAPTFNRFADRLGVSTVVVLDLDLPQARWLDDNPDWAQRFATAPFLVYTRGAPLAAPPPREVAPGRWRVELAGAPGDWAPARVAYYPLWRAEAGGQALPARRGELGDLEVRLTRGGAVDLLYGPGAPEYAGAGVSLIGLAVGLALAWRARTRGSP
jgi:hypothetical protein